MRCYSTGQVVEMLGITRDSLYSVSRRSGIRGQVIGNNTIWDDETIEELSKFIRKEGAAHGAKRRKGKK